MILEEMLKKANVLYSTCTDVDEMVQLGIMHVPMLRVNGDELMGMAQSIKWIQCQKSKSDDE